MYQVQKNRAVLDAETRVVIFKEQEQREQQNELVINNSWKVRRI
jgi:hypothetical protein